MTILKHIKRLFLIRQVVFEITSDNGLLNSYALHRAKGEGGKPDPKLEALLAHNAQKLEPFGCFQVHSSGSLYLPFSGSSGITHQRCETQ